MTPMYMNTRARGERCYKRRGKATNGVAIRGGRRRGDSEEKRRGNMGAG